jgi:glycosyltransferase involved in cell wall biosynthesis
MENGKIKVWLPAIQAGSGTDVFTRRLAAALERHGLLAQITWFPLSHELLPSLLQRAKPPSGTDIILAGSWNGFAFKHSGIPLVVVVHHCVFDPDLRPYKSAPQHFYHRLFAEPRETRSLRAADAVVAVSQYAANHLRYRLGQDDVKVIYNWVDTGLFKPKQPDMRGDRPFRLLFVGKLTRLKGGDMLAPLMRMLGADFELRFTASPHDCRNMDFPPNMIPIGRLSEQDMIRAYQECDALLLPSRAEGFGYAALEAMACEKPVIASDNTALPELIEDGVTGILCRTGDIDAFSSACRQLAQDAELCARMGKEGRLHATARFAGQEAVVQYMELITRLLGGRTRKS